LKFISDICLAEYRKMIFHYNKTPIFYTQEGQGPALVLLHGFLGSSRMWIPFIPALSKKRTVVTIDLPGHGQSGCLGETHSMELMAEVVNALLETLKIDQASFVGHSMGGYISLAFAEKYEAKMSAIILLNSTPDKDSKEKIRKRERLLKIIPKSIDAFLSMAIVNLFSPETKDQFVTEIGRLKKEALTFPVMGITAAMSGMKDRKDRTAVLKKFPRYKLIISAKDDSLIPLALAKEMASACGVPIKIVDGGHMSHLESYDEIVKIVHFIE